MLTRATVRAFSTEGLKVMNDVAKKQFVVKIRNDAAVIGYERDGKKITFVHTDVPEAFQGKGVGKILAKHAFSYAVENKLDVTCQCDFLAHYYKKNKQLYKSLKYKEDLK